jgi:hypothetical protein
MTKFSNVATPVKTGRGPLKTKGVTVTHEGGKGYVKGDKTALFTLAVTNMVGEQTFYESASERDSRFVSLVHTVTQKDPAWVARFIPFLRNEMQMRSAAVVVACEYVKAGGPNGRAVVASACSRADEPAEILAYWMQRYGRNVPQPVKRGVADAARGLYNEYAALKYDGGSRGFRMGDVINLTHPRPVADWQGDLFKYVLDRRYQGADAQPRPSLRKITLNRELEAMPANKRRAFIRSAEGKQTLKDAGFTWERLSGWLPGGMDAEAWEAVIPSMGYMALLRNLRNFDQAGISAESIAYVKSVLGNEQAVLSSRQFPYRFLSARKELGSVTWLPTLDKAANLSLSNVPALDGKTLVLVDTSGSMESAVSDRSKVTMREIGAMFGAVFALRNEGDLVSFGSTSGKVPVNKGDSLFTVIDRVRSGQFGHGTNIHGALAKHWTQEYRRAVIFSDMQTMGPSGFPGYAGLDPSQIPVIYSFDLRGYAAAAFDTRQPGRYMLAGFTDKVFKLMPMLERAERADWPF